ncbi:hypothetical protein ACFL3E_00860 [Patescibacteria group bacterium]
MIVCPAMKVEPSPDYDPDKGVYQKGHCGSQGAVSWGNCIPCRHNRGFDLGNFTIKCGYDPENIIELESIPI